MNRFQLSLGQQTDVLVLKVNHAIHIISYTCLQVQMRLVFQQVYLYKCNFCGVCTSSTRLSYAYMVFISMAFPH